MSTTKEWGFNYKAYPVITTPNVILKWPSLVTPNTKFDPEGKLETQFLFEDIEAGLKWQQDVLGPAVEQAWKEFSMADANKAKVRQYKKADLPGGVELDKEGEETGKFQFKAGRAAKSKNGPVTIPMWDTAGNRIDGQVDPWGGTVARLKIGLKPYVMASSKSVGISLSLREVLIIQLSRGGDSATGFGDYDGDGYVHQATAGADDNLEDDGAAF